MKRGGIEGPVIVLLFLLAVIIGLVAYIGRDHQDGSDEHEWVEKTTVRTETPMSLEQQEDLGESENSDDQQEKSQQEETPRSKMLQDLEENMRQLMDLNTIE